MYMKVSYTCSNAIINLKHVPTSLQFNPALMKDIDPLNQNFYLQFLGQWVLLNCCVLLVSKKIPPSRHRRRRRLPQPAPPLPFSLCRHTAHPVVLHRRHGVRALPWTMAATPLDAATNSSHTPPAPPHPRIGRPPHLCFLVGTVDDQHLVVEAYHRPTHTHTPIKISCRPDLVTRRR
jgi:hypothetical protein